MARCLDWAHNLIYAALLLAMTPVIAWKAWRGGKYRHGWKAKLWGNVAAPPPGDPAIWMHAVSVGEVNLLATTIQQLTAVRPKSQFVITTTTQSGYELAMRKYGSLHTISFCPFDFSWAVARALDRIHPCLLILAELELWPNLISAAHRRGIAIAIINGRLGDQSFRGYQRIRPLVARVLRRVDLIAAQNDESADRFRALGAPKDRVVTTGSLKYDGAATNRRHAKANELRHLAQISDDEPVFLAGSTQAPEEEMALDVYRRLRVQHPRLRLILAPRHPERFDEVARLLDLSGLPWQRRSALAGEGRGGEFAPGRQEAPPILLVDTVGELGAWWASATVGFVGGSFGNRGGQNMIEPTAYGVPTCFGPNTWNFRDIVNQLLGASAACVVADQKELAAFVLRTLDEPVWGAELGERAKRFVATQQGSTARTVDLLLELLNVQTAVPPRQSANPSSPQRLARPQRAAPSNGSDRENRR